MHQSRARGERSHHAFDTSRIDKIDANTLASGDAINQPVHTPIDVVAK